MKSSYLFKVQENIYNVNKATTYILYCFSAFLLKLAIMKSYNNSCYHCLTEYEGSGTDPGKKVTKCSNCKYGAECDEDAEDEDSYVLRYFFMISAYVVWTNLPEYPGAGS